MFVTLLSTSLNFLPGFEYHLSARAVKFIRDQEHEISIEDSASHRPRSGSASIAAKAVKRMLVRESREDGLKECDNSLIGWEHGISERKAHLCLLLKPQVILQSTHSKNFTLLLAADHVVLRNHGIVDDANIDDPVSGHIMQRLIFFRLRLSAFLLITYQEFCQHKRATAVSTFRSYTNRKPPIRSIPGCSIRISRIQKGCSSDLCNFTI